MLEGFTRMDGITTLIADPVPLDTDGLARKLYSQIRSNNLNLQKKGNEYGNH